MTGGLPEWERELLERDAATADEEAARDKSDALILRQAAVVMRRRSKRPDSFMTGVFAAVLRKLADRIEHGP